MSKHLAVAALVGLLAIPALAADKTEVGSIVTTYNNWYKPGADSDRISVERFDDPKVQNVSCYVSRAQTGGYASVIGMAEDPSRFSIACRPTGPVKITGNIERGKAGEDAFKESASALFKTVHVTRMLDAEKNVLIYVVWAAHLKDGSPYNAITAVPVQ